MLDFVNWNTDKNTSHCSAHLQNKLHIPTFRCMNKL